MSDPPARVKVLDRKRKENKMFSLCETCGYTAEPQDMWCSVCYRNEKKFVKMIRKVGN